MNAGGRWILTLLSLAVLWALPAPGALGQDSLASSEWQDNPCLLPEELTVIELMASRSRELDQREELVLLQEQALMARQEEVQAEMERLQELRDEIEKLIDARAAARAEGADALVQMVNSMRSSDAAAMLSQMDTVLAAAVLERLSPRQAGRILGGMDPRIAAKLSASLAVDPIEVQPSSQEVP